MLQSEVIQKLAVECHALVSQYPDQQFSIIRKYIQMGLCVGLEHFTQDMEEIVALDLQGVERGVYKSTQDASNKLGICRQNITAVVNGRKHSVGGYIFMKRKDYQLLRRPAKKSSP